MTADSLPNGLIETIGFGTTQEAANRAITAIETTENIGLMTQVDHAAGGKKVGLELAPTIELFFGGPAGGTPLMQIAPTAGIDLPHKMLIIQTESGVRILHNDPAYLGERHGIPADTPQLVGAANLLQKLANTAAGLDAEK